MVLRYIFSFQTVEKWNKMRLPNSYSLSMEHCVNDIANLYKHDFYCYVEMNCCLNGKRKIFPKNKQFHCFTSYLNWITLRCIYYVIYLNKNQPKPEMVMKNEKKNSCEFKPNANLIDVTREEKKNGKIDLFYCVSEKRKNLNFKWFRKKTFFFLSLFTSINQNAFKSSLGKLSRIIITTTCTTYK